jgi:peptide/nickel transport system substrate-binding protein
LFFTAESAKGAEMKLRLRGLGALCGKVCLGLLALAVACGPARTPAPAVTVVVPTQGALPSPTPTHAPAPPSLSPPTTLPELTLCLADEPRSLYLYARPEPGRDHILAALYDGPIDAVNYGYQPVLLEKLPSVADGDAAFNTVRVNAGDVVVDALGRVITLAAGVTLAQPGGEVIAYAGSGAISVPQMVVTFRLRPGVRWSDGQPLTAADSVFSFEVSRRPDSYNPRRALAERTASYRALNETTVEWTGLPGYLDPLSFTNFWTPLPRHRYEGLAPTEIADSAEANRNPLGWGPFVLAEWVQGDHLTFERNPNYFRAPEGLPRFNRVTYRILPHEASAILAELQAGQCDIAPQTSAFDGLSPSAGRGGPLAESGVNLDFVDATLEHLDFGIAPAPGYTRSVGNDFFRDVRARRAIAYCLDRSALADIPRLSFYAGWEPPFTFLPANHPLYRRPSPDHEYLSDPARGRALLSEMAWTDSDGDGTPDKDGIPLRLTLVGGPVGDPIREALLPAIQSQLKANCGIEIETRLLTRGEMEGDWPDGVIFGRRFDLAVFGWRVGSAPPCELFTTAQIPDDANPGGANDAGYSNPQFDDACRRALTTFDPQLAAPYHQAAQRLFAEDLPMLPLFFRVRAAAARANVADFALDPTAPSELWNLETMTLAP